ncbi:MAG: 5'/3'-nucleotidase SurE [Alphaproteobacteria bacterium]|nr:5'/3'-nucleotidase SurE [Alphaproteobacteria bacterium]
MRILVSNDDGFDAPGIRALADAVMDLGDVWVVAPDSEQSAKSHSLTLAAPLRARRRGERRFAVDGTPADCIYLGAHGLLDGPPDLVLSGVNRGSNLGTDVHYSGTVAAAREAVMAGFPAVAISLHVLPEDEALHWDTACHVARHVARDVVSHGLPPHTLLNVNVPNIPRVALKGVRTATLGVRRYANRVLRREDPWGRHYYWIGGPHLSFADIADSDGPLVEQGYASVTPLHSDPTLSTFLEPLRDRLDT